MALARQTGVTRPGRQRAQRHALIQLDVAADDRRLADDDAGAVVDEEPRADLGAGVDIDTGAAVGVLRHDAGDHGNLPQVQLVGDAVDEDGEQAGVGEDDLLPVGGGGVAVKRGLDVRQQHLLDVGQLRHDSLCDVGGVRRLALRQRQRDLGGQRRLNALQQQRGVVLRRQRHQLGVAEIGGEEQPPQLPEQCDDGAAVRQTQLISVHGDGCALHGRGHGACDIGGICHACFLLTIEKRWETSHISHRFQKNTECSRKAPRYPAEYV